MAKIDELEARITELEDRLRTGPPPAQSPCPRCGGETSASEIRPSVVGRIVRHCARCAWDFEQ